jgi:hypothetical protein
VSGAHSKTGRRGEVDIDRRLRAGPSEVVL